MLDGLRPIVLQAYPSIYISLPLRAPPQPRAEPQACFFFRLRKVLDLGCNAVLAYQQDFDVEGDSGIVARAYGTACVIQRREPERTDHPLVRQVRLFGQQRSRLGPACTNKWSIVSTLNHHYTNHLNFVKNPRRWGFGSYRVRLQCQTCFNHHVEAEATSYTALWLAPVSHLALLRCSEYTLKCGGIGLAVSCHTWYHEHIYIYI